MKDDIIRKIGTHLKKPFDDESWPVYLLAEIRKLCEKGGWLPNTRALRMCCHWALHVDLTMSGTVRDFFEPIERWITHSVSGLTPSGSWTLSEEQQLFRELLFLDTFREELRDCLSSHGLSTSLCEDHSEWVGFLALYTRVIEDGSLTLTSGNNGLAVSSVMFSRGSKLPDLPLPFVVRWDIALSDGRWATLNLQTLPNQIAGARGISHALQIS